MVQKSTYEALKQRIKALEKESGHRKALEAELKRYKSIIDSAQDAIFFKDLESRYIMVNDKTLEAFGMSEEEVIGKNDYELMPDEKEAEKNVSDDQIVFKSGKHTKIIKHITRADGRECWFQTIKVPQFDNNEKVAGLIGIARDITEHKRKRRVQAAQLRLIKYAADHTVMEFLRKFLDEAEVLTRSEIGFYHFLEDDQRTLSLQTWSTNTLAHMCAAKGAGFHYPLSKAGVWVDCVREGRPVIHNDYASLPHKKGLPEGHAPVIRELVVPVFRGEKIKAILGVGNKQTDYDEHDVNAIQQLADLAWETVTYKRAEEALRESEEKFRGLVESSSDWIWEVNSSGVYTYSSPKVEEVLGYSPEEVVGKTPFDLMLPEEAERTVGIFQDLVARGKPIVALENANRHKDGRRVILETSGVAIFNAAGTVIGYRGVDRDITERKQAEEKIRKLNETLEQRVAERTAELENRAEQFKQLVCELSDAKQKAEAANLAKSNFLTHMSHELRTPLNAILGFSRLLERESSIAKDQMEKLELIHRSGEHLLALINEVLDMSKIEAGQIEVVPESFDLTYFVREIARVFRSRAAEQHLQFTLDHTDQLPSYIRCDQGKMRQVLFNLLGNAIKFTPSGGITLRIYAGDAKANAGLSYIQLYFEITDSGIGIEAHQIDSIFTPFFQARDQAADKTGAGLGLAISRRFVRLMGGDITVSSQPGKGSTFTMMVPVEITEQPDHPKQKRSARVVGLAENQPECRVLVVDDSHASRLLLSDLLQAVGIKVRQAEDGRQALDTFAKWQPDLIFMDIRMPVMDGKAATRAIKATAKGKKTPIIAVTAHGFNNERQTILAAGCDDFIRKPFDETELFNKLAKHLNLHLICADESTEAQTASWAEIHEISPARLEKIPAQIIATLKEAAIQLDVENTKKVIEAIAPHDDDIAKVLSWMIETFRFDKIIEAAELHPQTSKTDCLS